jgi:biopolymer transport protein ExbB/TolQ
MSGVEKRFLALTTIAAAAPLLGMTGTVTGMITAFDAMKDGVTAGAVASGISEALITTAAGLLIALLAVIPYNYFLSRSSRIELELSEVQSEYTDLIIAGEKG